MTLMILFNASLTPDPRLQCGHHAGGHSCPKLKGFGTEQTTN